MSTLIIENPNEQINMQIARNFCARFCSPDNQAKYVFGRNVYADSIAKSISISGFIDDYASDNSYLGLPIFRAEDIPRNALVLIASGGKPLSAKRRLDDLGIECLDYFAFYKHSGLALIPIVFNESFAEEFYSNETEYEWVYGLLNDEESRSIFRRLINFRLTYDIDFLSEFSSREGEQYFEDFLQLQQQHETFLDVGGYNGFNSLEFIRLCPGYRAVHIFEPEPENYRTCVNNLQAYSNIQWHQVGLSNRKAILKLDPLGSGSRISDSGSTTVAVDRLDDLLSDGDVPTFIKMDIEGTEMAAIEGASHTIKTHHPRLAICVYHNVGDFWRIPKKILGIRSDYSVYLRHYTESIYETVMFFMPRP